MEVFVFFRDSSVWCPKGLGIVVFFPSKSCLLFLGFHLRHWICRFPFTMLSFGRVVKWPWPNAWSWGQIRWNRYRTMWDATTPRQQLGMSMNLPLQLLSAFMPIWMRKTRATGIAAWAGVFVGTIFLSNSVWQIREKRTKSLKTEVNDWMVSRGNRFWKCHEYHCTYHIAKFLQSLLVRSNRKRLYQRLCNGDGFLA